MEQQVPPDQSDAELEVAEHVVAESRVKATKPDPRTRTRSFQHLKLHPASAGEVTRRNPSFLHTEVKFEAVVAETTLKHVLCLMRQRVMCIPLRNSEPP